MVKIEFFKDNISLGVFECMQGSNHEDSDLVAKNNGITDYDKVSLDNDRVIIIKDGSDERRYTDKNGVTWKFIS